MDASQPSARRLPPVEWHDAIESTQDRAHALAEAGAPEGTAVAARMQTRGRGTRGRRWSSGFGGLWISIVLRPRDPAAIELLSLRVGLALAAALERDSGGRIDPMLKWPNDLYLDNRKLGGILVEARWHGELPDWVTVGVGVNLTNELPPDSDPPATRTDDRGWSPRPESVAPAVVAAAVEAAERAGELSAAELAGFERRDWLRGRRLRRPVSGTIQGLAPSGRLLVRADRGEMVELLDSRDLGFDT